MEKNTYFFRISKMLKNLWRQFLQYKSAFGNLTARFSSHISEFKFSPVSSVLSNSYTPLLVMNGITLVRFGFQFRQKLRSSKKVKCSEIQHYTQQHNRSQSNIYTYEAYDKLKLTTPTWYRCRRSTHSHWIQLNSRNQKITMNHETRIKPASYT